MTHSFRYALSALLAGLMLSAGGCSTLSPGTQPGAGFPTLQLARHDRSAELWLKPGFDAAGYAPPVLDGLAITGEAQAGADQQAAYARLRRILEEPFASSAPADAANGLHMDILLEDLDPASPGLNALSAVLLFVPLDGGAVTLRTTYRDMQGQVVALRRDRVSGRRLRIKGALSAYGRLEPALADWANKCAQWPACVLPGNAVRRSSDRPTR